MHKRLLVQNARVGVETGLVLDARGAVVRVTRYVTGRKLRPEDLMEPDSPTEPFESPLVIAHNRSWRNYFHWLTQTVLCAWDWSRSPSQTGALFLTPMLNDLQAQSLRLAGLGAAHHHQATYPRLSTPLAVIMPDAFGPGIEHPSARIGEFGRHISRQIPSAGDAPRRLYVSRRDSRKRSLENESELEAALARHGFSIVTLTGLSFSDQVRLFRNAEVVVGPHGAGLANLVFCQPGTRVVELTPSTYISEVFVRLSAICTLSHEVEIFPGRGEKNDIRWRADIPRVLDRVLGRSQEAV